MGTKVEGVEWEVDTYVCTYFTSIEIVTLSCYFGQEQTTDSVNCAIYKETQ